MAGVALRGQPAVLEAAAVVVVGAVAEVIPSPTRSRDETRNLSWCTGEEELGKTHLHFP